MKAFTVSNAEYEERSLGSSLDPVLHGVARGLAALFPPIETIRHPVPEHETGRLHEPEDERAGD